MKPMKTIMQELMSDAEEELVRINKEFAKFCK